MVSELILVVDDEPNITNLAKMYLTREGFRVEIVADGRSALDAVNRLKPALIVLDIMLPYLDGMEVCRRLRVENNPIPIIMVTARDEDIDKILGLEMGADDYLTKPFNPHELVARVKAILRRYERARNVSATPIHLHDIVIDPARREVTVRDRLIDLRTQEFDLLLVLAQNKGLALSREKLLSLAWGYDYAGQTRTVDVHIGHVRKKLVDSIVHIETVSGIGYKLVV